MRKFLAVSNFTIAILCANAFAYDVEMAKKFNEIFSQLTPEVIAKRPCEIDAKKLFEMIKKKEPFVLLDC